MAGPEIKIIALSNVYNRLMYFKNKGDVENGHKHTYDHATLVSSGSILYEVLDDIGNVIAFKEFVAPNIVYVNKDRFHRITSLEEGTVCACIHAVRTIDQEIVDPDFLIEPIIKDNVVRMDGLVKQKTGKVMLAFTAF